MREFKKQFIAMNRSSKKLNAVGMVLHETATQGATAQNEFNYFNKNKVGASAHAFVDWNESVQFIPWDEQAWHAKNPANQMFIGVEMCRPKDSDPKKLEKMNIVYNASIEDFARVFKYILNINKITKDNLMSHDEVRLKWNNTTHTDPTSYLKEISKSMDVFRQDVQNKLNQLNSEPKPLSPIAVLSSKGILTNIESWEDWLSKPIIDGGLVKQLIINFHKYKTSTQGSDFITALNYTVSQKVITSKNYYLENCMQGKTVKSEWVTVIVERMCKLV